jgi:iduronate 2-sulfatase
LTGQRPDTTRVYDLVKHFRTTLPNVVTLPQYFQQNGYHAQGMGKIYHNGLDDKQSWSVPHWMPRKPMWGPEGQAISNGK